MAKPAVPLRPGRFALITAALATVVTAMPAAYVLSGPKWPVRTVNYYINPANADVSEAAAEAALQAGAATWGSQSAADFRFYYMGRTGATTLTNNGRNEIFFRNTANGSTIAETYWWSSNGRILDSDMVFYDGGFRFYTGSTGCSGGIYLEDTAAHEFGHALGLSHSADASATMYYSQGYCSTSGRTLSGDDLAGVEALYPPTGSGTPNVPPSVALTSPAEGTVLIAPATVTIAANATDSDGSIARVDFLVNGGVAASDSSAPFSATLSNLGVGNYSLSALAVDNQGGTATATARGLTVTAPQTGSQASVTFVKADASTRGTWKSAYGGDGFAIVGDTTSLPAYAQVHVSGQSSWTWSASTSDPRALQRAGADRVMAAWYGSAFTIDVNIAGSQPRQLALYAADYDGWGREQRVDVLEAATGALLDSRTLTSFSGGEYLVWTVVGHVRVQVTRLSGPNAVVSGLLFGGEPAGGGGSPGGAVSFLQSDATTQGTWKAAYGTLGHAIAADATSLPSEVQLTMGGQSDYTWAASSTDVRAAQRAGSGRVMAAWYGSEISFELRVAGNQPRQVSFYSADFDNWGREQRFDLIDGSTGAILDSRTISGFSGGRHLVWSILGHVRIKVVRLHGPNAVVSALLIGGAGTAAPAASAAFLASDVVTQGSWKGTFGSAGYAIAEDATGVPSYAQLTIAGHSTWSWASSSGDGRALERAGSGRVMAAWYGASFTFDVNVTGQPRQVAIYSADYDSLGRQQRVDVIDAASGAILDTRTLSAFSGGSYLSWAVQGHVVIRVTSLAGPNALVSGLFFQ